MMELGDRIKYLREKKEMTQKELCDKAHLTIVQLSRYETNDRKPDPDALKRIVSSLETNADYLLGLSDDPSPYPKETAIGSRAYYSGGKDWTEEEIQAADDFIKLLRKKDAERKKHEDK